MFTLILNSSEHNDDSLPFNPWLPHGFSLQGFNENHGSALLLEQHQGTVAFLWLKH